METHYSDNTTDNTKLKGFEVLFKVGKLFQLANKDEKLKVVYLQEAVNLILENRKYFKSINDDNLSEIIKKYNLITKDQ